MWELQGQKRSLHIICNAKSLSWDWMETLPSRFVNEMPEEGVEKNDTSLDKTDSDFDFNQDASIEYDEGYRSPGQDRYKKINCLNGKNKKITKVIKKLKFRWIYCAQK